MNIKSIINISIYIIVAVVGFWLVSSNLEAYSNYGNALLLAASATLLLIGIDKFILHEWDTVEELKKNNIAVGLALLAYSVLIGSCILAAFIVFK